MMPRTDLFLFESDFARDTFETRFGRPPAGPSGAQRRRARPSSSLSRPAPDACDVVDVGELRHLKGIDVLIDALSHPRRPWTAR